MRIYIEIPDENGYYIPHASISLSTGYDLRPLLEALADVDPMEFYKMATAEDYVQIFLQRKP